MQNTAYLPFVSTLSVIFLKIFIIFFAKNSTIDVSCCQIYICILQIQLANLNFVLKFAKFL